MNILFVFPYCSPETNSISGGPIYLGSVGHSVLVITARYTNSLKGKVSAPEREIIGGTEFYRPYPDSKTLRQKPYKNWDEVKERVKIFNPDVVVGFGEVNYRLPIKISRYFHAPLFIYMENLRPDKIALPIRGLTILRRYLPHGSNLMANAFLRYLAKHSEAIMYAYYGDRNRIPNLKQYGTNFHYVPWCTDVGWCKNPVRKKNKTGIYIGSLEAFKNSEELIKAIPLILEESDTELFTVVGPGYYAEAIKELKNKYKSRIEYIESVPRETAIEMIRSADYGYTPVTDCGLGFIGDCWGAGTPLVATHLLDGFLIPNEDTLIAKGYKDLPRVINSLLKSETLAEKYRNGGLKRYDRNYTGEAVGKRYLEVINASLKK